MSVFIWLALIAADLAYELYGIRKNNNEARPLTYYVRELMRAYWPAKLILIVLWVWLGSHFFLR